MEAVLLQPYAPEQSISPYRHVRNPKKTFNTFISRPSENFSSSNLLVKIPGGLFFGQPPSLSSSFPSTVFNPQQQPGLLPLPISKPYSSLPSRNNKGLPCPATNRKITKTRDQDLTTKKRKPSVSPKKQESKQDLRSKTTKESLVITSTNRLGPDPSDIPKEVSQVLKPVVSSTTTTTTTVTDSATTAMDDMDKFSGSIFSLSPPPSSLPLPKFSLRPKLTCNVDAGEIDAGATDNLCRLLRLR